MSVTFAKGFSAAGVAAGISSVEGKKDLALVVNQGPLDSAAGVFTFNRFCAAPVQWSRKTVADGHIKAVILNSGGANACTGQAGYEQSAATAKKVAELVGTQPDEIAVCSTGLIGELLPLDHVLSGVESAYAALSDDDQAGSDASHAIMTTDTKPKTVSLEGDGYRIGGMVKGSGMIAPQLATMLCVITTDAAVGAGQLQAALNAAVDHSFNRIDVDGCMSTNDTVLLLASGASGVEPDPDEFNALVAKACASLARQIIGDGEGATTCASPSPAPPRRAPPWPAPARSRPRTCSNAPLRATTRTGDASYPRWAPCPSKRRPTIRRRSPWTSTA